MLVSRAIKLLLDFESEYGDLEVRIPTGLEREGRGAPDHLAVEEILAVESEDGDVAHALFVDLFTAEALS